MTVFYLVRHAHAYWTSSEDRPLSDAGQVAAQKLAKHLSSYPIARIFSSPARRARQTLAPLTKKLDLTTEIVDDLRERKLSSEPVSDFFYAVECTWQDFDYRYPGGETNRAAQMRGVAVIRQMHENYPGEHIALATHGNLMALVLRYFDPSVDFAFWRALTMPDVYSLVFTGCEKPTIQRLEPATCS